MSVRVACVCLLTGAEEGRATLPPRAHPRRLGVVSAPTSNAPTYPLTTHTHTQTEEVAATTAQLDDLAGE